MNDDELEKQRPCKLSTEDIEKFWKDAEKHLLSFGLNPEKPNQLATRLCFMFGLSAATGVFEGVYKSATKQYDMNKEEERNQCKNAIENAMEQLMDSLDQSVIESLQNDIQIKHAEDENPEIQYEGRCKIIGRILESIENEDKVAMVLNKHDLTFIMSAIHKMPGSKTKDDFTKSLKILKDQLP